MSNLMTFPNDENGLVLAEMQDADNPSLNSVVSDIGPETTSQDSKF